MGITPASGYAISSVVFTATSEGYATALKNSVWTNATAAVDGTIVTVTPTDGTTAIGAVIGGTCGFTSVKVYYVAGATTVPVTITAAEYATFVSSQKVDFEGTGITAYTITISGDNAVLKPIKKVAAGTPVVVYKAGADGTAIDVPITSEDADAVGVNALKISDGITATKDNDVFLLAKPAGEAVGFYKWNGDKSLSAGKVYLQVPPSTAREFLGISIEGEATGITDVRGKMADVRYFNLNGQKVQNPGKGLYIVNGKKVVKN